MVDAQRQTPMSAPWLDNWAADECLLLGILWWGQSPPMTAGLRVVSQEMAPLVK